MAVAFGKPKQIVYRYYVRAIMQGVRAILRVHWEISGRTGAEWPLSRTARSHFRPPVLIIPTVTTQNLLASTGVMWAEATSHNGLRSHLDRRRNAFEALSLRWQPGSYMSARNFSFLYEIFPIGKVVGKLFFETIRQKVTKMRV